MLGEVYTKTFYTKNIRDWNKVWCATIDFELKTGYMEASTKEVCIKALKEFSLDNDCYEIRSGVDQPVPGDYKGEGRDDIGIFRGASGLWAISGVSRAYFGGSGDIPVSR